MKIENIQKVLTFLEDNYHRQIEPEELEAVSNYSYRNIQRIFSAILLETIGDFCTRLKLENAYKQLIYTNNTIVAVAYDVGYSNNQSFAKAFKNKFEITPLQARQNRKPLFEEYIKGKENDLSFIDFEYEYKEKIQVYSKTLISNNYNNVAINELWDAIIEENKTIPPYNCFGVIVDQPIISDKEKSRYEACIGTCVNPKLYLSKAIFGGWYAKYIHLGDFDKIEETYRKIYYRWLYESDYELGISPIIEQYIDDEKSPDQLTTAIYVPVKRKLSK
ncbi:AraC family transcriptional regulator [Flavobacterium sp. Fl-318]|uniref:AraC family transcriptional regulator n=1 Tax=Flavobacterium cupriresistens TaxID=2893885 RepID=A0ABU4RC47_9FLAO|nr:MULTISPECIES: AraC family transcriptional regulator [unclassified Flavobacterium]MDX6189573.1 AraC family transcriptional regulator [Flavobacterium sp. Fl-318]UFH41020.1 AraC family transcriptional regulator [Flavobacterium sp. F-323]